VKGTGIGICADRPMGLAELDTPAENRLTLDGITVGSIPQPLLQVHCWR
jgi:hypothetical protein